MPISEWVNVGCLRSHRRPDFEQTLSDGEPILCELSQLFYTPLPLYRYLLKVTSLIGFHPLVSITLFLSLLEPLNAHLSTLSFAIVLVTCSIMTVMYSPYNLSVSLLSHELKVNPYKITKWNIGFAMSYMLIGISAAYIIHLAGW